MNNRKTVSMNEFQKAAVGAALSAKVQASLRHQEFVKRFQEFVKRFQDLEAPILASIQQADGEFVRVMRMVFEAYGITTPEGTDLSANMGKGELFFEAPAADPSAEEIDFEGKRAELLEEAKQAAPVNGAESASA